MLADDRAAGRKITRRAEPHAAMRADIPTLPSNDSGIGRQAEIIGSGGKTRGEEEA
jgi:hypothetical protein